MQGRREALTAELEKITRPPVAPTKPAMKTIGPGLDYFGKLRALAVASAGRTPVLPNVPTFTEAGLPEFAAHAWGGLVAPGGTPAPVIERLAQASARAVQRAEFREFVSKFGAMGVGSSAPDFARYLRNERTQYQALIAENNIRME